MFKPNSSLSVFIDKLYLMKNTYYDIIIIGAGIAGISAIKKIRELDKKLSILLVSDEDRLPYKRTKVNKHIEAGFSKNSFQLFNKDWYVTNKVSLIYGKATHLDSDNKILSIDSKMQAKFKKLLFANGAQPFIPVIEGVNLQDIMLVHYANTVERLQSKLVNMQKLIVIGGGVEGIETAYELHKLGKSVVIVDSNKDALGRLFPDKISKTIYNDIAAAGVHYIHEIRLNRMAKLNSGYAFELNGEKHSVDGIIACAGTRPNVELAQRSGLKVHRGIQVNAFMQTSNPDIFAAGDVAEHDGGIVTGLWHPAEYQGLCAGENMVKLGHVYQPVPQRLKTSVFGAFYFTANYMNKQLPDTNTIVFSKDNIWGELYLNNNCITGLVMMNDKENSKVYHNLVAKNLTLKQFKDTFPSFNLSPAI